MTKIVPKATTSLITPSYLCSTESLLPQFLFTFVQEKNYPRPSFSISQMGAATPTSLRGCECGMRADRFKPCLPVMSCVTHAGCYVCPHSSALGRTGRHSQFSALNLNPHHTVHNLLLPPLPSDPATSSTHWRQPRVTQS